MKNEPITISPETIKFLCLARDKDAGSLVSTTYITRDIFHSLLKQTAIVSIFNRLQFCIENSNRGLVKDDDALRFRSVFEEICALPQPLLDEVCYAPLLDVDGPISLMDFLVEHSDAYDKTYVGHRRPDEKATGKQLWHQDMLALLKAGLTVSDEMAVKMLKSSISGKIIHDKSSIQLLQGLQEHGKKVFEGKLCNQMQEVLQSEIKKAEFCRTYLDLVKLVDVKKVQTMINEELYKKAMLFLCCARQYDEKSFVSEDEFPRDMFNVTFKR